MTRCPRCGHVRSTADTQIHAGICPACGIAYTKWKAAAPRDPGATNKPDSDESDAGSLRERLLLQLAELPEDMDATGWTARVALFCALALWTLWFGAHGVDWEIIGGSFLHSANLAFHEFGHVFFRPFGEFMTILGGSLFQVLLPLAIAVLFALQRRDNIAAAAALWWCGQNFVDVAPYIRDAEYRVLPLVGGADEAGHDWGNLLTGLNAVDSCYALARASFALGLLVMASAIAWAAWLLWRWKKGTDLFSGK